MKPKTVGDLSLGDSFQVSKNASLWTVTHSGTFDFNGIRYMVVQNEKGTIRFLTNESKTFWKFPSVILAATLPLNHLLY